MAILFLLAVSAPVSRAEFARVGYINSREGGIWDHYLQLFNGRYTHIVSTFLIPDSSGVVTAFDALTSFGPWIFPDAQAAGSKVLFSIGGSTVSYKVYMDIAANVVHPGARQDFIDNVVAYMTDPDDDALTPEEYDGVDINFEGWSAEGVGNITAEQRGAVDDLILDLAQAVKAARPAAIVTTTLAPLYFLPVSPSAAVVNSDMIDMAHHMSYDFNGVRTLPNGPYRVPGSSQGLYGGAGPVERSVYGAFSYLYAEGYDLSKVTGGVPFYGYDEGAWDDIAWNSLRGPAGYWSLIALHSGYLEKWDPDTLYWANDTGAIGAKIAEYRRIGLAGVMVWQVGDEGVEGDLSTALYNAATSPDPALVFPQMLNFQPPLAAGAPASAKRDSGAGYGSRGDYGWR